MLKILRCLFIITGLLLQSCQHSDPKANEQLAREPDLKKASQFNVQLGLGYLKQGDRPRAKKKLLTALKQDPQSADVNAAMAYYFEQTNEIDQAKKYYTKAIDLSSNSGAQLNNYGTFLCRQGDYKKADAYFMKAVKDQQYVHTSGAYENAGLCALAVPDNEKAEQYFKMALEQDPSRRESLYELVKLESKIGHNADALKAVNEHIDVVSTDKLILSLAKDIASKEGKTELALAYENNIRKLESNLDNSGVNNEYNSHTG